MRSPDHGSDDEGVTEHDDAERYGEDYSERYPRSHVEFKVSIFVRRTSTVTDKPELWISAAVVDESELGASCPQHVQVLADGGQRRGDGVVLGLVGAEVRPAMLQREADGDEPVDGERDTDPDGRVAARVEHELLQFAQALVELLEDDVEQRLDPLGYHAGHEDAQVGDGHPLQVEARGSSAHAPLRHNDQDEDVAAQADDEDARPGVDPQSRRNHWTVRLA